MNDPDVERVELDQPVCDDRMPDDPNPATVNASVGIASFDPTELTWNIDRLDQRRLPLDGQYCPAALGKYLDIVVLAMGA